MTKTATGGGNLGVPGGSGRAPTAPPPHGSAAPSPPPGLVACRVSDTFTIILITIENSLLHFRICVYSPLAT